MEQSGLNFSFGYSNHKQAHLPALKMCTIRNIQAMNTSLPPQKNSFAHVFRNSHVGGWHHHCSLLTGSVLLATFMILNTACIDSQQQESCALFLLSASNVLTLYRKNGPQKSTCFPDVGSACPGRGRLCGIRAGFRFYDLLWLQGFSTRRENSRDGCGCQQ